MANSVNAGANELKRANFGSNLEQWKAKYEGDWSVATFQCRDVLTSRRWVNQYNSQQAVMSRRGNVATSARDLPSIIKSTKGLEFEGGSEAYERGHGIPEQQRHRLRRSTLVIVLFPIFGY